MVSPMHKYLEIINTMKYLCIYKQIWWDMTKEDYSSYKNRLRLQMTRNSLVQGIYGTVTPK